MKLNLSIIEKVIISINQIAPRQTGEEGDRTIAFNYFNSHNQ